MTNKKDEHIWDGIPPGSEGNTCEGLKVKRSMSHSRNPVFTRDAPQLRMGGWEYVPINSSQTEDIINQQCI